MSRPSNSSKTAMRDSSECKAVVQAIAAIGAGVGNNFCIKLLSSIPSAELAVLRSGAISLVLIPLAFRGGRPVINAAILARGLSEAVATVLLLYALSMTSLSLVATIMMAIPIAIMFVSQAFEGERLPISGNLLVLVAFAGALLASGPAFSGNPFGVGAALISAICFAARDLITRLFARHARIIDLSLSANFTTLILALMIASTGHWVLPSASIAVPLLASVVLYIASNLLIAAATKGGRSTLIAATRYTAILWAMLADLLFFKTTPGPAVLGGALLIVLSGLGLVFVERTADAEPRSRARE